MEKKNGGKIKNWQLHHLTLSEGQEESFNKMYPELKDAGLKPMMFTGTVVEDPLKRWKVGWHMRSSLIIKIDRKEGIIETLNTIYEVDMKTENQDSLPDLGNNALDIFY